MFSLSQTARVGMSVSGAQEDIAKQDSFFFFHTCPLGHPSAIMSDIHRVGGFSQAVNDTLNCSAEECSSPRLHTQTGLTGGSFKTCIHAQSPPYRRLKDAVE